MEWLNDAGLILQIVGFSMMVGKLGESVFFELDAVRRYGIRWRKKTWKQTPDLSKHTMGVMTLFGKRVPAIEVYQMNRYTNWSKTPDRLHSVGLLLVIAGLVLHFSIFH